MIIVNQDRTEVFNFNGIYRLFIDKWFWDESFKDPDCFYIRAEKNNGDIFCNITMKCTECQKSRRRIDMLKLEETKHSYYCECWETKRTMECNSWEEFKDKCGLDYDFDCNLLFRYDLEQKEDDLGNKLNSYILKLHHALQRHERELWHVVIHNITEKDLKEINEHLQKAKQYLFEIEIDLVVKE